MIEKQAVQIRLEDWLSRDIMDAMVGLPDLVVVPLDHRQAASLVVTYHYLHRRPPMQYAFGLVGAEGVVGVLTLGIPASRHLQIGMCPTNPDIVIELNRLWVHDSMPRNSETWFIAHALRRVPPRIIVSYADTLRGHVGYVYRAANFHYAGWTDMERKTPRYDYIVPGKHTREAFRGGAAQYVRRVRRAPKVKYWTVTGDRRQRRDLARLCRWPSLDWHAIPPPVEVTG